MEPIDYCEICCCEVEPGEGRNGPEWCGDSVFCERCAQDTDVPPWYEPESEVDYV